MADMLLLAVLQRMSPPASSCDVAIISHFTVCALPAVASTVKRISTWCFAMQPLIIKLSPLHPACCSCC
jgi:hypothetical protein